MIDSTIRSCGLCVRAEFADEEGDDLRYVAKPGAEVAHLIRPRSSEGTGDWVQKMVWSGRTEPFTYCGKPVGDDWRKVEL